MLLNVLNKVGKVNSYPYPHIIIEDALPDKIYVELDRTFPEEIVCSTPALDGGITYRYKSNPVLYDGRISQIWHEFFDYHTSDEYFKQCMKVFEPFLEKANPTLLNDVANSKSTVRNIDNSGDFVTDCQFVVHEPIDETGTSRTPHLDNPVEIYAGLLYMRKMEDLSLGGNLQIHDISTEINRVNKKMGREIPKAFHNPFSEVIYSKNVFCMFLNLKNSVHGVTPRINPIHRRRSINIIGEFNNNGQMWSVREEN